MHPITELVRRLVLGMCGYPEDLEIEESFDLADLIISIKPKKADYGLICGREGRVIKSLEWLVTEAGKQIGIAASVRLIDTWVGSIEPRRPFVARKHDIGALMNFISEWLSAVGYKGAKIECRGCCGRYELRITGTEPMVAIAIDEVFLPYSMNQGIQRLKISHESQFTRARTVVGNK